MKSKVFVLWEQCRVWILTSDSTHYSKGNNWKNQAHWIHRIYKKGILVEMILNYLSYVKALMLTFCLEVTFIN